jgi:HAD superfamily hydrolase (TIGR01484 family)
MTGNGMKVLATDLDRTLLPNGRWEADPGAIGRFNELTSGDDLTVVYVTGRNLDLTERAIAEFGVRYPDYLCGDVGTTVRQRQGDAWVFDEGWVDRVHARSPRWSAKEVREALEGVDGIREQEAVHLNRFKQSYYADHGRSEAILEEVEARVGGRFDEVVVYSFDSKSGDGLIDVLPNSATKQTALEYVAEKLGVPKGEVVFCGDSGNDIFPLTAGFRGVLVRNADEQLVENVKRAQAKDPGLRVYYAEGGFEGLSGYYTSGVLEGARHYGLI